MTTIPTSAASLRELKAIALDERSGIAWPTFWLAGLVLSALIASWTLSLTGVIPLWVGCIINTFWMYQGYTLAHESVHKNLHGKNNRYRWLNEALGAVVFFFPMHSYAMHQHIHGLHHKYTNDPERDPDIWVTSVKNPFLLFIRCYTLYFYMSYHAVKTANQAPKPKRFLIRAFTEELIPIAIAVALIAASYGAEVFWLWMLPAISTFAAVGFFLDWIPHYTDEKHQGIRHTALMGEPKGLIGEALTWLYLFHNYHLIHHLYPYVPWYALRRVYKRGESALRAEGARIIFNADPANNEAPPAKT